MSDLAGYEAFRRRLIKARRRMVAIVPNRETDEKVP
jgi:hypothetical protein